MKARGLALALGALGAFGAMPAAGQNYDFDAALQQFSRAIDHCNAVGYGSRRCQENRDEVRAVCDDGRQDWCALAERIDEDGTRESPFPSVSPLTTTQDAPVSSAPAAAPAPTSSGGSIVGGPGSEAMPPKAPEWLPEPAYESPSPQGAQPDGEGFDDVLDRLTEN